MKLNTITVNNFKSLVNFEIRLSNFTCLVGLNGSGKSTLLQFIDFLGQQMRGDLDEWFHERRWKATDINSRLTTKRSIDFKVSLTSDTGPVTWEATFNTSQRHCTSEKIRTDDAELTVEKGSLSITKGASSSSPLKNKIGKIPFKYQGSVLSQLTDEVLPDSILSLQKYLRGINSLDMLSPEHLRKRKKEAGGKLGFGGECLAPFLHEMPSEDFSLLQTYLKKVYPHLESVKTQSLKSGWKQIQIGERFGINQVNDGYAKLIETEARHVNDGMLRLMAILAALRSKEDFLLFDEIENGINPELVEFLIDRLTQTSKQVMVTTHSPMILNYIEDERAKKAVIYLYRTKEGFTNTIPYFSILSQKKKLEWMGPGEAFVDTNLTMLQEEIYEMKGDR